MSGTESLLNRWEPRLHSGFNSFDASVRTCWVGTIARLNGNVERQQADQISRVDLIIR